MCLKNPKDISYVFSGYAPLSIRLMEILFERPNGWNTFEEVRVRTSFQVMCALHLSLGRD